jgi:AmiR/NasT family two-component response regulator
MTNISHTKPESGLTILVADESRGALDELASILERLGHEVTPYAVSVQEAVERIATEDPDCAFVMVHHDDEHALALISEAVEFATGPVIAHLREADVEFVSRAADRGIAAYVETMSPEAVQGAIEVALRRYRETANLNDKVEQLETALERRTVIERAKGILMERHGVGDREAFEQLREHARAHRRRVYDMANAVLEGHALLPKGK